MTVGVSATEYAERRRRLMEKVEPGTVVVLVGHATPTMTYDIPYRFRQHSDVAYLCGIEEPDCVIVLRRNTRDNTGVAHSDCHEFTLFVPPSDPGREMWDGPRAGIEGGRNHFRADRCVSIDALSSDLTSTLESCTSVYFDGDASPNAKHNQVVEAAIQAAGMRVHTVTPVMHHLRLYKSRAEQHLMRMAAKQTCIAAKEVMRMSGQRMRETGHVNEHHIDAAMEYHCRIAGAQRLAYPPVVAGDDRGTTLHYVANDRDVAPGGMVLMDAGAEYCNYSADITRTWPVSGTFNPVQRRVYEAVLEVHTRCIDVLQSAIASGTPISKWGVFVESINTTVLKLIELGVIVPSASAAHKSKVAMKYYPHDIGHYLGMDVHDTHTVAHSAPLKEGMVITIEPGLYFPRDDEALPLELRGVAVRIEDDILITKDGVENLTADLPRTVTEVERLVQG